MIIWKCKQRYGACRQAVKTSDCGSDMHGFESHQAPHLQKRPQKRPFLLSYCGFREFEQIKIVFYFIT